MTRALTVNLLMTPLPILMYHQIDARPARGTPLRGLIVTPKAFAAQMRWLARLGYRGVAMRQLLPLLNTDDAAPQQQKVVGITFDDGYLNNLEYAAPILQAHGFSATCYVIGADIGASNHWDQPKGIAAKPLMNASDLRQWIGAGLEVGGHGQQHIDLRTVAPTDLAAQLSRHRQQLADTVGQAVEHFCYPYGQYNTAVSAAVKASGFLSATTTRRGRVSAASCDRWQLPRVPVMGQTSTLQFLLKLLTAYEDRAHNKS